MKKIVLLLTCMFAVASLTQVQAADKKDKKEKKPKKEISWTMPELTGNEDFDLYLKTCDTLYTRLKTYSDSIVFYHAVQVLKVDESGNAIIDALGDSIVTPQIQDEEGNTRGTALAAVQYAQIIQTGTSLLADLVNITALTTVATAAAPGLGLKALSYAKYLKVGPQLLASGTSEIKEIMQKVNAQRKQIRIVRKYHKTMEKGELKNPSADARKIPGFEEIGSFPTVKQTDAEMAQAQEQINKDNQVAADSGIDPDAEEDLQVGQKQTYSNGADRDIACK